MNEKKDDDGQYYSLLNSIYNLMDYRNKIMKLYEKW